MPHASRRTRRVVPGLAVLFVALGSVLAGAPARAPLAPDDGWLGTVSAALAAQEYEFGLAAGECTAPNRAQGLRTRVDERGVAVVPRLATDAPFELRLELERVSRGRAAADAGNLVADAGRDAADDDALPLARGTVARHAARATIDRGAVREWIENRADGVEHGVTLDARAPGGDGPLRLRLALTGTLRAAAVDDTTVALRDADGRERLRYAGLVVTDALGTRLAARLGVVRGALEIEVDDRGARYPVEVDPLLTTAAWATWGGQAGAHLGYYVTTAGDVNGDGYSDALVAAPDYDVLGASNAGRIVLFNGTPSGLSTTASWSVLGHQANQYLGLMVKAAGDVNGDGYDDVLTLGDASWGYVVGYYGSAAGLADSWYRPPHSDGSGDYGAITGIGDFNGDGYDDILLGEPDYAPVGVNHGLIAMLLGGPNGLPGPFTSGEVYAGQNLSHLGDAISAAQDIDGDGYADFVVGDSAYERIFVFHGNAGGTFSIIHAYAATIADPFTYGGQVEGIGDFNGDGYADVLVSDPQTSNANGRLGMVELHLGSAAGLITAAAARVYGTQAGENLGDKIGRAGDVNGDGYADFVVGSPLYDGPGGVNAGRIYLFEGRPGSSWATLDASQTIDGTAGELLPTHVETAGDCNGDGYSDVLVGTAFAARGFTDEGRAQLLLGAPSGLASGAAQQIGTPQAASRFGLALAPAGDVNGDGFSDVVVGAPYFDSGAVDSGCAYVYFGSANGLPVSANWRACGDRASVFLGRSVAGIGDVDNDGYGDIAVGAPDWDGQATDDGRVFAWFGSSTGLGADGTPANADWVGHGDAAGNRFGEALAALDADGDGFSDLLVGGQGKAWLYLGNSFGLETLVTWSQTGGSSFGLSLAGAGDVNRDGFDDAIIGEKQYTNGQTNEGAAHVYLGSPLGLSTTKARTWESNGTGAFFGTVVAAAGDVDGDGYDDVLVGADQYDASRVNAAGRVDLYYGSPSGPEAAAGWTRNGTTADERYGFSIASGDFDNDGFSDFAVGTPYSDSTFFVDNGRIEVFLGAASGPAGTPDQARAGAGSNVRLGARLAGNLDINGDGFGDLVASRLVLPDVASDGGLSTYYGGGGDGLDRTIQQRYLGDPIAVGGMSGSDDTLTVAARARTAAGRGLVHVDLEVQAGQAPFSGAAQDIVSTAVQRTSSPTAAGSYVDLYRSRTGLHHDIHRWRARTVAKNPWFPRTPWFSLAGNSRHHYDVRMHGAVFPGPVSGLRVSTTGNGTALQWNVASFADTYDVSRGTVSTLRSSSGDFAAATTGCVANDRTGTTVTDLASPATGDALWYLVRSGNPIGNGTYDEGSAGQHHSRDAGIALAPQACP